ncbi:hypothetical protein AB0L57_13480 [Nocardia sp. NPDC052254]|uniref:hypothetical protein n=1 Tax=Nocardia sp. NPDC052254 TaxID=3155681 RepID=UPI003442209F
MQDPQTPQQALDIAAAATRQARGAAALLSWGPVAAGVFGGLAASLLCVAADAAMDSPLRWAVVVPGIAGFVSGAVFYLLGRWLRHVRRARGIIPLPPAEWKQIVALLAVVLVVVSLSSGSGSIWLRVLSGSILAGWIWFQLARPQIGFGTRRPWTRAWKN